MSSLAKETQRGLRMSQGRQSSGAGEIYNQAGQMLDSNKNQVGKVAQTVDTLLRAENTPIAEQEVGGNQASQKSIRVWIKEHPGTFIAIAAVVGAVFILLGALFSVALIPIGVAVFVIGLGVGLGSQLTVANSQHVEEAPELN